MSFAQISEFALSWGLAGMAVFFGLAMLWIFRPGSRQVHAEAANAIFRHDAKPAADPSAVKGA